MKETLKNFRDKLNNNDFVYGPFIKTSDPMFVEAVGLAGFDYVILDMEHGPVTIENQQNNIRAAEARNTVPIIRLKDRGENTIGKASRGASSEIWDGRCTTMHLQTVTQ